MVYLAKVYHTSDAAADDKTVITVSWMARKLMKEANLEKINNPQVTLKVGLNNSSFCWCGVLGDGRGAGGWVEENNQVGSFWSVK